MRGKRRWIVLAVVGLGLALILSSVVSAAMTNSVAARPMTLARADEAGARIPVWKPVTMDETQPPDTARMIGGAGVWLGLRMVYLLPDGDRVTCTHRPYFVRCSDGWSAGFAQDKR